MIIGLILGLLIIAAAVSAYKFANPTPAHYIDQATMPPGASGIASYFGIPKTASKICFFSANTLRCDYFISCTLSKSDFENYVNYMKKNNNLKKIEHLPQISSRAKEHITAWWPEAPETSIDVYQMERLDYLIFNHKKFRVYGMRCED